MHMHYKSKYLAGKMLTNFSSEMVIGHVCGNWILKKILNNIIISAYKIIWHLMPLWTSRKSDYLLLATEMRSTSVQFFVTDIGLIIAARQSGHKRTWRLQL